MHNYLMKIHQLCGHIPQFNDFNQSDLNVNKCKAAYTTPVYEVREYNDDAMMSASLATNTFGFNFEFMIVQFYNQ